MAGDTSSSYVSERETDKIDDDGKRAGWRLFVTDADVPAGVDPEGEWEKFLDRNGDGAELSDPAAAFRGWLRTAPTARQRHQATAGAPTPTPARPECPEHPGQPTGSVQCPECAREHTTPPRSLRALRDEAS